MPHPMLQPLDLRGKEAGLSKFVLHNFGHVFSRLRLSIKTSGTRAGRGDRGERSQHNP